MGHIFIMRYKQKQQPLAASVSLAGEEARAERQAPAALLKQLSLIS